MGPPGQGDGLWRGAMQAGIGLKAPFLPAVFSMTHTHLEKVRVLPRPSEAATGPLDWLLVADSSLATRAVIGEEESCLLASFPYWQDHFGLR